MDTETVAQHPLSAAVVPIIMALGTVLLIPLFRLVINRMEAADRVFRMQVKDLKVKNQQLEVKQSRMDEAFSVLQQELSSLRVELQVIKHDYAEAVANSAIKSREISELTTKVTSLYATAERQDSVISELKEEVDEHREGRGLPPKYKEPT